MAVSKVPLTMGQRLFNALSAWTIKHSGYRRLGLRVDDLHMEENADVAAALEMLPTSEKNLRMFRLRRATDLSLKHAILPQDQWTKPEEDILYLAPYIERAKQERLEKQSWNNA